MASRRAFLAGMLAAGAVPRPTWAEAGNPSFLSAAQKPDGGYVLCGLTAGGAITFERALPDRGHAAAAHPIAPDAVVFARRPGTYAVVLDCRTGRFKARLAAPAGRHFYGHGAFSGEGDLLFTTENDYEAGVGVIGVWAARNGYARLGEFASGGVGPHDIKLLPDGSALVVANGGIETHPETGRSKLNLPTMRSNLTYLDLDGAALDQMELGAEHQRNSIRHLAVTPDGGVAFAMQWQGDMAVDLPLLGMHRRDRDQPQFFAAASVRAMQGYLGSVAVSAPGRQIAVTSPRRGRLQVFDADGRVRDAPLADVCGVATTQTGFVATTGTGIFRTANRATVQHARAWDNHLLAI